MPEFNPGDECNAVPCVCGNCDEQIEIDEATFQTVELMPEGGAMWSIHRNLAEAVEELEDLIREGEVGEVFVIRRGREMTGAEFAQLPEHTGY